MKQLAACIGCSLLLHGLLIFGAGLGLVPSGLLPDPTFIKATIVYLPSAHEESSSASPASASSHSPLDDAAFKKGTHNATPAMMSRRSRPPMATASRAVPSASTSSEITPPVPPFDRTQEPPCSTQGALQEGSDEHTRRRQDDSLAWHHMGSPGKVSDSSAGAGAGIHVAGHRGGQGSPFDGSLLASFTAQIRKKIELNRSYPAWARKNNIEGIAVVRFTLAPNGSIEEITIEKSSGSNILDEAAKDAVLRGAPYPAFPPWLTAPRLALRQPIRFSLEGGWEDLP